jgi:hypothetical protein
MVNSLFTRPAAPGAKVTVTLHIPLAGIIMPVQPLAVTV